MSFIASKQYTLIVGDYTPGGSLITDPDASPILALHIATSGASITFKSVHGDTITLASGSLVQGGIYYYSLKEVTVISGTIYGIAPSIKPYII